MDHSLKKSGCKADAISVIDHMITAEVTLLYKADTGTTLFVVHA